MSLDDFALLVRQAFPGVSCDVHASSRLADDLGLCSYDIMVLVTLVESRTGRQVDVVRLSQDQTVAGLLGALVDG